jgi:hypothetical protein
LKEPGSAGLFALGLWVLAGESRERSDSLEDGILQDNDSNKRQTVEIQVGP